MEGTSKTTHADALLRDFPHTPSGGVRIPEHLLTDCNRLFDNYIFYETVGRGEKRYICTNCYQRWCTASRMESYAEREIAQQKHNDVVYCPHCGERLTLKNLGVSKTRRSLDQTRHLLFLWAASENLVYGAAAYVYKKYSDECETLQLDYSVDVLYTFEPGESHSWRNRTRYQFGDWRMNYDETHTTAIPFASNIAYWAVRPVGLYDAVQGSFLRYCAYDAAVHNYNCRICDLTIADGDYIPDEEYAGENIVLWLADYCRYPKLEMLAKLGFRLIINGTTMAKRRWAGVLNWNAKTPQGFFKMSKADFKMLTKYAREISVSDLQDLEAARAHDKHLTIDDFMQYKRDFAIEILTAVAKRSEMPFARLVKYLNVVDIGGIYDSPSIRLTTYRDYLDMAESLGFDLTQEAVRIPKKLKSAHDRAVEAYNAAKVEREKHAGEALYSELAEQYAYENEAFLIRPPYCAAEIVAEGQALHHCVAGYAARHCKGKTVILFLRRKEDPDVPYFTMEMDPVGGLHIMQIHGLRNKNPDTPELCAFVESFKRHLRDEKAKKESKSNESAIKVQVAV